ncbi:putative NADP-dependent mannitol dehydrogenase [Acaromyces ingoldii]|uniref:Putative NADP-dependent mannitol dehydrogenase n=1 Tax=Acaromyces ingoldii TaxID=215250 RepID=A0A316YBZ0_9BASI|nr:putative NADP-dependent mannitol dehydrogenase [Acaromyces ingoldii]PWN86802.1 putative NADP-dependent mannitol dehydrogenase [Acaromyces ingoldii]
MSSFSIDLSGGLVIVTGGNRGIGLAMTRAVATAGADVAVLYRSHPKAQESADAVAKEFGVKVKAFQCDVGDLPSVEKAVQDVAAWGGKITGLMANAGVSVVKPAFDLTPEDFHKVYDTNVLGVFNIAKTVAKYWVDSGFKGGAIVVTSSMSSGLYNQKGLSDPLTQAFYNSSKGAVTSLSKALAAEWAPYGIRLNILEPGYCNTEQTSKMASEIRDFQAHSVPLQRFSEPHEQAFPAVMLLSSHASYLTGSVLRPDGGFTIW